MLSAAPARADVRLCVLFCLADAPPAADSFTRAYEPVIRAPADAATVKAIPDPVRKRIERNEALYRCAMGWKNPICGAAR